MCGARLRGDTERLRDALTGIIAGAVEATANGELIVGDGDVRLGEIGGCPFYMSVAQYEYWKHTQLTIDVVPGRGGMFSLEGPEGLRFLTRSRLFSDEELAALHIEPAATSAS